MTDDTADSRNNAQPTRGVPFQPGNPGRPKGARHKVTRAVEALLEGQAEALTQKAIEAALEGDMTALRLCLERIAPLRKGREVRLDLPKIETSGDVLGAIGAVVQGVADGEITPDEGQSIAALIETQRRSIETVDHEQRLARLEAKGTNL